MSDIRNPKVVCTTPANGWWSVSADRGGGTYTEPVAFFATITWEVVDDGLYTVESRTIPVLGTGFNDAFLYESVYQTSAPEYSLFYDPDYRRTIEQQWADDENVLRMAGATKTIKSA